VRVLITGSSGFVGAALARRLAALSRWTVRASSRARPEAPPAGVECVIGPELAPDADWRAVLAGVDVVVHLAARVHDLSSHGRSSRQEFHRVNVLGTRRLAEQAVDAGVRRLVFLSSVKVHGEHGRITEDSAVAPVDAYAASKRDGEATLRDLARTTGLELVIVRPPLVYGPGAQANIRSLMTAVRRGIPLPLGAIANRRSLVAVDNLADLIVACLDHPAAVSEAFLVSDGDDLSTPELVRGIAAAAGCRARLVPVPVWCLRMLGAATGKAPAVGRLTGSLQVDISKARRVLGWVPPVSVSEGLRRAVGRP